jgi:hypothetical protein
MTFGEKKMCTTSYFFDPQILLVMSCLYCFALPAISKPITFEHVIIDEDGIGHREVGDIDRDGFNDIVAVNSGGSEHSIVWYEYPSWKRHRVVNISSFDDYKAYRSCDMELADVDDDGDLDVVGRIGRPEDDRYGINCWFENPSPRKSPDEGEWKRHDIGESYYAKDLEVADLNGDGRLDVVSRALNARLHIYLQEGSSWKEKVLDITHHDGMEVSDMDKDGDPDIVLNGYWMETPNDVSTGTWLKHDYDKKWYTQKTGQNGAWYDNNCKVDVADMNADDRPDIIIDQAEDKGYPVSWYQAPADPKEGKWIEHVIEQVDKCHSLKVADFDNDGDLDVFAAEMPNIAQEAPHPVLIFINQGDSLTWRTQVLADYGNYSAQIGDIDNDGDIDIIGLRNHNRAPIEMWRNTIND